MLHAVLQLCTSVEWGPLCLIFTSPCPVDATKFWWHWPHCHLTQTSVRGQHLSGVWRGEILKVLSQGCRVDAVTPSSKLCDGFLILDAGVRPCIIMLKQHFTLVLAQLNTLEMLPHFVQHADTCIWVKCHSSLHHINENHSLTVPEHHDHHVSGWWRTSRSCAFPTSQSLTLLSSDLQCSCRLHCFFHWKKELLLSQHVVTTVIGRLHFEELQQRYHASGSFVNSYIEWGKLKYVVPEVTAF